MAARSDSSDSDFYEVFVLQEGYSYTDSAGKNRATGTITLLKGRYNILVDTGSPWDGKRLVEGLKLHGLTPEAIHWAIGTHGHVDHVGNLNLFQNATHVVSHDICEREDVYADHDFDGEVPFCVDGNLVQVISTPGHTHSDVSVVVRSSRYGTVVVCGDLFECENDDELWPSLSECPAKQEEHRRKVRQLADWIIPGHGKMFKVERESVQTG